MSETQAQAEPPRIGWIGLGKMGLPMCYNVLAGGYRVACWNRSGGKAATLLERGATHCASLRELAATSDIVVSMVADDAALHSITIDHGGLFEFAGPELLYVDMSTVSPAASEQVAIAAKDKGIQYLRSPVSGSTATAAAAALTVFVSGPRQAYDRCAGLLECIGKKRYYLGESEQARYLKLSINMMVGITAAMVGESLALSERGGVDWLQMIEIMNNSVVASPLIGYKAQMLGTRDFSPMFTAAQMAKDFDLALGTGRSAQVPLPLTALAREFMGALVARGRGELDFFAYVTLLEELAGLRGDPHRR